jgi:enterochelin esterase-like enzyme
VKYPLCFLLAACLFIACTNAPNPSPSLPTVSAGSIERIENFASAFLPPRNIDIWLPPGYDSRQAYAVLYMHDGQMLFDATTTWNQQEWGVDEVLSELIGAQKISPCIVVAAWNTNTRHSDYFPQKPFESLPVAYRDSLLEGAKRNEKTALFSAPIQSDAYLRFLVQELKPYIDSHYATRPERAHTFIAGSSMGGLISMYAICEYPEVFGGAACLSTHWPGIFSTENNPIPQAFADYLSTHLPDPATHKLYFDYGTETLDALYEPYQLQADSLIQNRGYDSLQWKTLKFPGENHSEASWRKRLGIPITFLIGTGE